jgi:predicted nuclease of predicted toxin-antitoxin system
MTILHLTLLLAWGYETTLVQHHIKPDAPDAAVIALAQSLDAVLMTVDMDFSNIVNYPPQNYGGIIVIRTGGGDDILLHSTLQRALSDLYRENLRGALVVVTATHYRVRHHEN